MVFPPKRTHGVGGGHPTSLGLGNAELQALVTRLASGERAALARIYEATAGRLLAVAWCTLHSKPDAEEVVSEVFEYLWARARSYDPDRGSVAAWLTMLARRRAIDCIRRRRDSLSLNDDRVAGLEPACESRSAVPEKALLDQQVMTVIRRAMHSLSAERRCVIELAFFHDRSHEQIAKTAGLPLGTVKSHLRRGLRELRRLLADTP